MAAFNYPDSLHRFLLEHTPIRGNIVQLKDTYQRALLNHNYPPSLKQILGELMAASTLLAATLKMQGSLILQIQGRGPLKLLVVECTAELGVRATAKWDDNLSELDFSAGNFKGMVGDGKFVITLDPKNGGQIYQGIVPLEGDTVAEILQNYMLRSEQIDTRIWLSSDDSHASGMLLQKLPDQPESDADAWNRVTHLAETITDRELLELPAQSILHRLFHEEDVRLFDAQLVQFHCTCSRENVGNMLKMLGSEEVHSILEERGTVEVHCDFCNKRYEFDKVDAELLFTKEVVAPSGQSRH